MAHQQQQQQRLATGTAAVAMQSPPTSWQLLTGHTSDKQQRCFIHLPWVSSLPKYLLQISTCCHWFPSSYPNLFWPSFSFCVAATITTPDCLMREIWFQMNFKLRRHTRHNFGLMTDHLLTWVAWKPNLSSVWLWRALCRCVMIYDFNNDSMILMLTFIRAMLMVMI